MKLIIKIALGIPLGVVMTYVMLLALTGIDEWFQHRQYMKWLDERYKDN